MHAFQTDLHKFESLNTQVLGVSNDTLETHQKFAEKYGLKFPLISDTKNIVKNLYGSGRITYLIDKKRVIRFIQKGVPENKDFLRELEKLERN